MTIDTFIFVHDQKIILDFIEHKKFESLSNLKFVFLGSGEIDKIKNNDSVIISRNLEHNIEQYPKLTSFTGWYSIWKNKLYNSNYINLFEYDINLSKNFTELQNGFLNNGDVIGYIPFNPHHYNFIGHKIWIDELENSIYKKYNLNISEFLNSVPTNFICSMTSNHTMKKNIFEKYMEWMTPMVDDIKSSKFSGHQTERSISLFYMINKISNYVAPNVLTHFQFDSHGTQDIPKQKFINNYKNLLS